MAVNAHSWHSMDAAAVIRATGSAEHGLGVDESLLTGESAAVLKDAATLPASGRVFTAFAWMLRAGWSEAAARNGLLLLMVLFENVHLGNCRSETRSALRMSPLRNPLLLVSAVPALFVHVAAMHVPVLQRALGTEPLGLRTWAVLLTLALTLFVAMELHKWAWGRRGGRRTPDVGPAFRTLQPAA